MAAELLTDASRAIDANANPLPGATWTFYATGTTTLQAVYANAALTTPHTNPVVADAGGKFAPIYFDATKIYRGILKTTAGVTISDIDPINSDALAAISQYFTVAGANLTFGSTVTQLAFGAARIRQFRALTGASAGWDEGTSQAPFKISTQFDMQNSAGVGAYILNGVTGSFTADTGVSAANTGSTISLASRNIIFNANDGTLTGWREYSAFLPILRAKVGGSYSNSGGNYWLVDATWAGPSYGADTTKREQFGGAVFYGRKLTAGTNVGLDPEGTGKPFWGSCIMTLSTNPTSAGGGSDASDNVASYTMNAGLDISGWAGPWGTSSGDAGAALPAFIHGLKIGGQPVNPWAGFGVRSKVTNGIYIQDATAYGLKIENIYDGATGAYIAMPALQTASNSIQGAITLNSTSSNTIGAFLEFHRHTPSNNWQDSQFRIRSQVDSDSASGAYIAFRGNLAASATDIAIGFGQFASPSFYLRQSGAFQLPSLSAAPATLVNGMMWYDSVAFKFRGRANGITVDFH